MPKAAIIIPNWNGKDRLKQCLGAVKSQSFKDFETIVVDNGSTDGSVEFLKNHSWVKVVALDKNYGFAGGVNAGIKTAQAEYVALLNNDAIPAADWLEKLVASLESHPEVGAVTSKILNSRKGRKGLIDSTGDYQSIWGLPFPRGRDEKDEGQYDDKLEVFGVSGGASLYRYSMLKKIGLFDERFFAYFEDVDLSFRAQLAGYKNRYCPEAVVFHEIGATSGGHRTAFTRYHSAKNLYYLSLKNMPGFLLLKYFPLITSSLLLSFISSFKHGFLMVHLKALGAVLVCLPGILYDRWRIQRGRKVSASYIDGILFHGMPPEPKRMLKSYKPF